MGLEHPVLYALMVLRRYSEEDCGGDCPLAQLPSEVLGLIRHWVVYDHLGLLGCCQHGCLETLQCVRVRVEERGTDAVGQCLAAAASNGHVGVMRYLVGEGAELEGGGYELLLLSTASGHLPSVRYLVGDVKVDVNWDYARDFNPLSEAISLQHLDIAQCLLDAGARLPKDGGLSGSCLEIVAEFGSLEMLRKLVSLAGPGLNEDILNSALLSAVEASRPVGIVRYLVEMGADVHTEDGYLLALACEGGCMELVRYIMEAGGARMQGSLGDGYDDSALATACRNGHLSVCQFLRQCGADVGGNDGVAIVHAARGGHIDVVFWCLEEGVLSRTALANALEAALEHGHVSIARVLVQHGADSATVVSAGLRGACINGSLEAVMYLVNEHSADIHCDNEEALVCAAANGHLSIVEYLVSLGACIEQSEIPDGGPLFDAAANGHVDVVGLILRRGARNASHALAVASENGHAAVVKCILEHGTDVDIDHDRGQSLWRACYKGHEQVVQLLVEHGARCDIAGPDGSPCELAKEEGHFGIVQYLEDRLSSARRL